MLGCAGNQHQTPFLPRPCSALRSVLYHVPRERKVGARGSPWCPMYLEGVLGADTPGRPSPAREPTHYRSAFSMRGWLWAQWFSLG